MKIRFYHWWIAQLYYKFWMPIFIADPILFEGAKKYMDMHIAKDKK